ncbi:hypothetical protein OCK02_22080 [Rhizobium sp. TRM96647]|uniref:hypothetical protein n=1 Tax=unclassified Rhizobium TaxID=2613769 RepID=UPI0021E85906|nr:MULTISPECIES: hypothetical protein [unclassified Rhizobium]MCV3738878.1 hypothetical protein [Rhizobium sp. TRM96647]MCV3760723.1 hypothetical protein [Rhizobium sp. TRM96650]
MDQAAAILEMHDGNALEAFRTLLAERDAVEEKLRVAAIAMATASPVAGEEPPDLSP